MLKTANAVTTSATVASAVIASAVTATAERFSERMQLTWSESRGRDTYGYNICRLKGCGKNYKTMGGGYDMVGAVLGDYLSDILTDAEKQDAVDKGMYGIKKHDSSFYIDGACGERSVVAIAENAGYSITPLWKTDRKGRKVEVNGYLITRGIGE